MALHLITLTVVVIVGLIMWDLYRPAHRDLPLAEFHWAAPLVGRISGAGAHRRS